MKKIPLRMCAITRKMYPKNELIRLVKTDNGIFIDPKKQISGRGVYVSKDASVLELIKTKRVLNKVFRCQVDDSVIKNLEVAINGNDGDK